MHILVLGLERSFQQDLSEGLQAGVKAADAEAIRHGSQRRTNKFLLLACRSAGEQ